MLSRALHRARNNKRTLSALQLSEEECARRQCLVPRVSYQEGLPIRSVLPEIASALKEHQVIVVAGETGSGKTTQIPLACLSAGLGVRGMIGHTQPRRLAARSVADRIAQQLSSKVGEKVGLTVRFDDQVSPDTLVKVMTDGILLTEIRQDRNLYAYDTLIIDEAHERSLNIDFLLGYLKELLSRRNDLRVIVTSATIDVQAMAVFFNNAPIFVVEGRSFPIEIRYRPIDPDIESVFSTCLEEIEAEPVNEIRDILVFLPGEQEIFNWARWLRKFYRGKYDIFPLYARLPLSEQRKIFSKSSKRRVLLATNVAETSLTVPNVRYVIDFGEARISRFSLRSRIQRLPIEAISQASANQRAGRCGRVAAGVCFRLYSEQEYCEREPFTEPQIKRTNLASVLLQMKVFGYGEIDTFPFLDRPDDRAVSAATRLLHELGALCDGQVTNLGRQMVLLPVDPRLARMLIEAHVQHALKELLIIVSALAVQDPFLRPIDQQQAADQAHKEFRHSKSDFLSYLNLWEWAERLRQEVTWNEVRQTLERSFISIQRYMEWRALHRQLLLTCRRLGMKINANKANFQRIHKAILSGSLSFVGLRLDNGAYQGARNLNFWLFPGSVLARRHPNWVVAATIVETSKVFARVLAEVKPNWIELYANSIMKKYIHGQFWDPKKCDSRARLNISIYGLPLAQNRIVRLRDYDRSAARELFLIHGLVQNHANIKVPEVDANRSLRESLLESQARERRTDLVLDEEGTSDFYRTRLPEEICDRSSFLGWYRTASSVQRSTLLLRSEDLLLSRNSTLVKDLYPADIEIDSVKFPLKYKFGPDQIDDGVSLVVRLVDLPKLDGTSLEWMVPGFLEEKCTELLRGLPKHYRKQLAPIPDKVNELVPILLHNGQFRVGNLRDVLSRLIQGLFHVKIDSLIWRMNDVSKHLLMNVQILDNKQRVLIQGRDLNEIRKEVQCFVEDQFDESYRAKFEQRGLREFPKMGLPSDMSVPCTSGEVTLFPLLVDTGSAVDLRVQFDRLTQHSSNLRGLSRLVLLREVDTIEYLTTQFNNDKALQLYSVNLGNIDELRQLLFLTAARDTFFADSTLPESAREFDRIVCKYRQDFVPRALQLMDFVSSTLAIRHKLYLRIDSMNQSAFQSVREDIKLQLERLFNLNFPYSYSEVRLPNLPRYLQGISVRLDRLSGKLQKDLLATEEMARWQSRLDNLTASKHEFRREELFFMLEEYRLSLFCQEIKTRIKVSPQRLEEAFAQRGSTV